MDVFQRAIQYNNVRPMILDQLNAIDVLKEMTELEKIEYLEKPTGLNAAFVTLKSEIPYLNPLLYGSSIEINRDDEHSKIYYKTDRKTGEIKATGYEAKEMLGRTPEDIKAVRPMKDGVIADFTATKLLLKNLLERVCKRYNAIRPRVIVGVPSGITVKTKNPDKISVTAVKKP